MTHEPRDIVALTAEFLRGRDVACPSCGYNLRNTAGDRCPECGAVPRLRLGASSREMIPWAIGTVAIAMPTAFCGVLAFLNGWAVARARWNGFGAAASDVVPLVAMTTLAGIGLLLLAVRVRTIATFLDRPRLMQWARAVGWLLVAVGVLTAVLSILKYRSWIWTSWQGMWN
jgi:hypothetical protein